MIGCKNGETARLLVPITPGSGLPAHIPRPSGLPLCNSGLNMSNWKIEERSLKAIVVCHICRVLQAKQARP